MAGARFRGTAGTSANTTHAQILAQGGRNLASGLAGGLLGIAQGVSNKRAREERASERKADREFRASENAKDRGLRRENALRDDQRQMLSLMFGQRKEAQAQAEREQAALARDKEIASILQQQGGEVPPELVQQIQAREQSTAGLMQKLEVTGRRIQMAGGDPRGVDAQVENPVQLAQAEVRESELAKRADADAKRLEKLGGPRTAIRAMRDRALLRREAAAGIKERRGLVGRQIKREIEFADEQQQMLANMQAVEDQAERLGFTPEEATDFVNEAASGISVAQVGVKMAAIAKQKQDAEEEAQEDAVAEDKTAAQRMAFEKRKADFNLSEEENRLLDTAMDSGGVSEAFDALTKIAAQKVKDAGSRGKGLMKPGSGGTSKAFKTVEGQPTVDLDLIQSLSDEAVAMDLGTRSHAEKRYTDIINAKWDMSGKSKKERHAKASEILNALEARGYGGPDDKDGEAALRLIGERLSRAWDL